MKKAETRSLRSTTKPAPDAASHQRRLPSFLKSYFWEYDFQVLSWAKDRHLVTCRILEEGGWRATRWLRRRVDDEGLRQFLYQRQGRGLSRRQLRYWPLILDLPKRDVDVWLNRPERQIWDNRGKLPCPKVS